jgi:hypothetical protein
MLEAGKAPYLVLNYFLDTVHDVITSVSIAGKDVPGLEPPIAGNGFFGRGRIVQVTLTTQIIKTTRLLATGE